MIITIGGLIGSGKSTIAREIADKYSFRNISAGEIFREMAKERGVSIIELGKLAEKNHKIDEEIDKRQISRAKAGDVVLDGRLSAHLVKADIKAWFKAPLEVRADRVAKREDISLDKAIKDIKKREAIDIERYKKIYSINLNDLSKYDIVLNTDLFGVGDIMKIFGILIEKVKDTS